MQTRTKQFFKLSLLMCAAIGASTQMALAADDAVDPLYRDGAYAGVLGTGTGFISDGNFPSAGGGVDVLAGVRRGTYALEAGPSYTHARNLDIIGAYANVLVFPFKNLPGLYGIGGIGLLDVVKFSKTNDDFLITTTQIGSGYLFPLEIAGYRMALRAEGLFRWGRLNEGVTEQRPIDDPEDEPFPNAPNNYHDVILRVGLHIPLPLTSATPPPKEVEVVPAPPPDTDGDGVADDLDQCPGTPPGTKVDAKGCPLQPPCKTPEAGDKVSLSGCATGESIVLRGVNFEFDKARLTPNAKVILDGVAEELAAHPDIKVEFGGHTDAKGSDEYNQKLSDARAKSVVEYVESKGIEASRMTSIGYGESQPVADNESDEGRELNRRVELKVTAGVATVAPSTDTSNPAAAPLEAAPAPAAESAPVDVPVAEPAAVEAPIAEPASAGN